MDRSSQAVLITGCSSGIGEATALRLLRSGRPVYATARRPEALRDLQEAGAETLRLDVTDEDSMAAAVKAVEDAHGAVWALVNNAGYSLQGAVETVPVDEVRKQFETNLFGLIGLTQMVLPGMRKAGCGRIVNMSSMGGRITLPGGAHYHGSKHALEAFSDVLRYEVRPFGIDVVVIQPGIILTDFADNISSPEGVDEGPYGSFNKGVARITNSAYKGIISNFGGPPDHVAKVVEKSLDAAKPRTRYAVTAGARFALVGKRLLPDRWWDSVMRRIFPSPKPHA